MSDIARQPTLAFVAETKLLVYNVVCSVEILEGRTVEKSMVKHSEITNSTILRLPYKGPQGGDTILSH